MKNISNASVSMDFKQILKKNKNLKKINFIPVRHLVSQAISFVYISQDWQIEVLL